MSAALTPPEHEHSDVVMEAARWYAIHPNPPYEPAVPLLRQRFGLDPVQACEAIKQARLIRARSN